MNQFGWMYEYGQGFRQDSAEAIRWYRRAAEQGAPSRRAASASCTSMVSACVAIDWKPLGGTAWRPTRTLRAHSGRSIAFGVLRQC